MANSASSNSDRGGQTLVRVLIGGLVCVAICLIVVFCVSQFGYVSGEEFDPLHFERRSFYYYELPVVGIQVFPVTRKTKTSALESYVGKLLNLQQANGEEWHVVSLYRSARKYTDGDASLLCTYMDIEVAGKQEWLSWSTEHPALAKVLWPVVANLARNRMYIFIPKLMESAKAASESAPFQQQVNRQLAEQYRKLAQQQATLDKHLLAVSLFEQALVFDPTDEKLKTLRATSVDQLSDDEKSRLAAMQTEREAMNQTFQNSQTPQKLTAEEPAS